MNVRIRIYSIQKVFRTGCRDYTMYSRSILLYLILCIIAGVSLPASATIFTIDGEELNETGLYHFINNTSVSVEQDIPIFFYDPMCGACFPAHEYLEKYIDAHPGTEIRMLSLSDASENRDLYHSFRETYHRNWTYIPSVYFGQVVLEGPQDIETYFSSTYDWFLRQKAELSHNNTTINAP